MKRVLFVCLGNICRSPMAEMMFKQLIRQRHLEKQISVDSVATSRYEAGNPIHLGARKELKQHQIPCEAHQARKITSRDFDEADLIIGMDYQNISTLKRLAPNTVDTKKIHLAADVLPDDASFEIADPWYTNNFDQTYTDLARLLPKWLDKIETRLPHGDLALEF
ncbi:low molecular weight protein-tyrosine-phosphatase [Agrilactobacillus fermenti]|uniref:low molecular weight protein-tyrosine-phosphatase n=1 Tax=Agrilactobacillus fermenti TaxID=2586909 RepID=UPI001E53D226|nr:low molecular weight protein-tyrosine-phosphatase [Agrilactobacillus fermenti]MCD2256742.1 low molecular weight phosphotyrosine protein phosphatase [Agrilactobacillus fermenti]